MKLQVSLIDATLEKTIISTTQSIAVKILKFKSKEDLDIFPIENLFPYSVSLSNAISTTGKSLGIISKIANFIGIGSILFGAAANLDISTNMIKAIQFILLFDKLRLINVQYENLLGDFMNAIYKDFQTKLIQTDDYEETSILKYNQFYRLREQVMIYRRKLDKLLLGVLCLVLETLIYCQRKSLKNAKNVKMTKKRTEKIEKLSKFKSSLIILSTIDIIFYCGHQILHQDLVGTYSNFEYCLFYILSLALFEYFSVGYVQHHKQLQDLDKNNLIKFHELEKKVQGPKPKMEKQYLLLESINGKSLKGIIMTSQSSNLNYITKICLFNFPILALQSIPILQVSTILIIELCYLSYTCRLKLKYGTPTSLILFLFGVLESVCIINFMGYSIALLIKQSYQEIWFQTTSDSYEIGILLSFIVIVSLQLMKVFLEFFYIVTRYFRKKRNSKRFQNKVNPSSYIKQAGIGESERKLMFSPDSSIKINFSGRNSKKIKKSKRHNLKFIKKSKERRRLATKKKLDKAIKQKQVADYMTMVSSQISRLSPSNDTNSINLKSIQDSNVKFYRSDNRIRAKTTTKHSLFSKRNISRHSKNSIVKRSAIGRF